jgi:predicted nucleotidyltransferase
MNILYKEHKLILQKILDKKVSFILVGGYAVNYYGYNRVTGDMDVWLQPDNNNKNLLITALQELDFDEEGLKVIEGWDFTNPQLFHIGQKPDLTDFMTHIAGVNFETAKANAIEANIDGLNLKIIHLNNLIENKKATGRLKDLADVEYLQKILHLKNKNGSKPL